MQIERTKKEILIRLSSETEILGLQGVLDFLKLREITSKSKVSQEQIDELASGTTSKCNTEINKYTSQ